jgi:hypothetical protein
MLVGLRRSLASPVIQNAEFRMQNARNRRSVTDAAAFSLRPRSVSAFCILNSELQAVLVKPT